MSVYRVLRARIYRKSGILTALIEVSGGNHGGRRGFMEVEGMIGRTVQFRAGRIIFDEHDTVTSKRILIVEPPDFPVEDLVGRRLLGES